MSGDHFSCGPGKRERDVAKHIADHNKEKEELAALRTEVEILQARVAELEGLHATLAQNHGTAIAERDEMEARVEGLEAELAKAKGKPWDG